MSGTATDFDAPPHVRGPRYREAAIAALNRGEKPPTPERPARPRRYAAITIRAHLYQHGGYGQIAEWVGRGLDSLGIPVAYRVLSLDDRYLGLPSFVAERVEPLPIDDVPELLLSTPYATPTLGRRTAFFSMWEVDGLLDGHAENLSAADFVIVPTAWNADVFRRAGVTSPIAVVPLGISADEGYRYEGPPVGDTFIVGTAGRMAHGGDRKGLVAAARAFIAAFPTEPDVRLRIKCLEDCLPKLGALPSGSRIEVHPYPLLPPDMAEWSRACTVGLFATAGEGWGLHLHQFMAVGRPILAPLSTGQAAYFRGDADGWPLPFDWKPARDFYAPTGGLWAEPTHDGMVGVLRAAYHDWKFGGREIAFRGASAATRAAEFTWSRTARELAEALQSVGLLPMPTSGAAFSAIVESRPHGCCD